MYFTESEAKTKWCPFARAPQFDSDEGGAAAAAINRETYGKPDGGCLCIASACMAWRYGNHRPAAHIHECKDETAFDEPERPSAVPADWEWIGYDPDNERYRALWAEPDAETETRRPGYCALMDRVG